MPPATTNAPLVVPKLAAVFVIKTLPAVSSVNAPVAAVLAPTAKLSA